jgi:hypothetical protein
MEVRVIFWVGSGLALRVCKTLGPIFGHEAQQV